MHLHRKSAFLSADNLPRNRLRQHSTHVVSDQGVLMKPIPISAAKVIADKYDYDQVVVIARKVGGGEHVTTYGRDKENCDVAARIGDWLKFKVMGWPENVA
jgi:hypothetical protein